MSCRCKKVTGWEMTAGQSQNGSFPSPAWAGPLAPQQVQTSDQGEQFPSQNCHPSSLVLQRKHGYHCWGLSGHQGWTAELDITQTDSLKPLLRVLVEDGWSFPSMEVQSLVRFSLLF